MHKSLYNSNRLIFPAVAVQTISHGVTVGDVSFSFPFCISLFWFYFVFCLFFLCLGHTNNDGVCKCVCMCLIFNSSLDEKIPSGLIGSCWPHDQPTSKCWQLIPYRLIIWLIILESSEWCVYLFVFLSFIRISLKAVKSLPLLQQGGWLTRHIWD